MIALLAALAERDLAFDAETNRLLVYAAQVGIVRDCCPEHIELSKLYVDAVVRRN